MAVVFTVSWTPVGGGGLVTLADLSARWTTVLEQLDPTAMEAVVPMFQAANPQRLLLGNVSGPCVFTATKSHADRATAVTFFKSQTALVGVQGSLVLTVDTGTLTMNPANFLSVKPVRILGVRWSLRYTFGITTIS